MATIQRGILSGFSGAIGSVTGAKSKGIDTMRARVTKPKNPQTAKQKLSREILTLKNNFFNVITYYTDPPPLFLDLENPIIKNKISNIYMKLLQDNGIYFSIDSIFKNSIKGDIFNVQIDDIGTDIIIECSSVCNPISPQSSLSDWLCYFILDVHTGEVFVDVIPAESFRFSPILLFAQNINLELKPSPFISTYFYMSFDFSRIYSAVSFVYDS